MKPEQKAPADPSLVAYCGLYCGACGSYLKGRCPGCRKNQKATWCKVRRCCSANALESCADCHAYLIASQCPILNNFVSKVFTLLLHSNRCACVRQIRELGIEEHSVVMAQRRRQTIKS